MDSKTCSIYFLDIKSEHSSMLFNEKKRYIVIIWVIVLTKSHLSDATSIIVISATALDRRSKLRNEIRQMGFWTPFCWKN